MMLYIQKSCAKLLKKRHIAKQKLKNALFIYELSTTLCKIIQNNLHMSNFFCTFAPRKRVT